MAARIQIVEDERIIAEDLKSTLNEFGYEVTSICSNAEQAISLAQKDKPDLILMDIIIDGLKSGIDAANEIKEKTETPIVYLTAHSDGRTLDLAQSSEPYGYIIKPFEEKELESTIKIALYRARMEANIKRLNSLLNAIRNINQRIVKEKDVRKLIRYAVNNLKETRGYKNAFVILFDEQRKIKDFACSDGEIRKQIQELSSISKLNCYNKALDSNGAYLINDPKNDCSECPVSELGHRQRGITVPLRSNNKLYGIITIGTDNSNATAEEMSLLDEIAGDIAFCIYSLELEEEKKKTEIEKENLLTVLSERVKEMGCLNSVNEICHNKNFTTYDILGEIANAIPFGFLDSTDTCARITIPGIELESENFRETEWFLQVFFDYHGKNKGKIEVFYLHEKPKTDIGPFLSEEYNLVKNIAAILSETLKRREVESKYLDSEAKFKAITDAAKDAIIIIDGLGKTIYYNKATEDLFGYSSKELLGLPLHEFIAPDKYAKQYTLGLEKFKDTGQGNAIGKTVEMTARNKNGQLFPVELSLSGIQIEGVWCAVGLVRDITERKNIELRIKETDQRLKGLYEHANIGIYQITLKGELILANLALVDMLNYDSMEELKSTGSFHNLYSDRDSRNEFLRILLEEGVIHAYETKLIRKNGQLIDIRESARVVKDEQNQTVYYEGTIENITEAKKIRQSLEYEKKLLQYIMNNIPDNIYFKDHECRFTRVNNAQAELLGIENPNDAIGKTDLDFFSEAVAGVTYKDDKRVIAEGVSLIAKQEELISKSGQKKWVSATKVPLKNIQGEIIGLVGISRDITELKQAEITLAENEKKYRDLFENAVVAIYRIDFEGNLVMANNEFISMLGFKEFKEVSQTKLVENGSVKREKRSELRELVLQKGEVLGFEDVWKKADGTNLYVSENMKILTDEKTKLKFFEGSVLDITSSKLAEEKMIEAKELAEKSDRLKSEFLAQMSHEIRTPINALLNFANLIRSEIEDKINEETLAAFDMLEASGNHITRTMELILQMSEIQSGNYIPKMEKFDLYLEVLLKLYNDFKKHLDKSKVQIKIVSEVKRAMVKGDRYSVEKIFYHLIDNAVKYTDKGHILIKLFVSEGSLVSQVVDTGIGMNPEYHKDIFAPFLQEDHGYSRKYDGSGLGLAVAKHYCDINGAEISFVSEKGKGTEFTVTFKDS